MMKNSYKMLFFFSLIMGTMISISSSSWFSIWMGLEINLLSFIPLSMKSNNLFSSEASLKYFLTQALASCSLLMAIILFSFFIEFFKFNNFKMTTLINLIFSSSLMMKSGVAPFHFWFPNVMEGLNWFNNFILMTWQKMAPIIILSYCMNMLFFNLSIIFSIFIGAMGGLNQTSLRKLMAFSSINHLGWMISNMMNNENIFMIYFIIYAFLCLTIIMMFSKFKMFNLNQMFSVSLKNKMKKLLFCIPLLSMGGLPPFLGFFPKWISIELLINMNFYFLIFLMINFSLITLYFYLRISYSSFLLNHNNLNWNLSKNFYETNNLNLLNLNIFFSIFGLMIINLFFFMF